MNEERVTLIFDGSALETHEINVKDLGHALIAMGDLILPIDSQYQAR